MRKHSLDIGDFVTFLSENLPPWGKVIDIVANGVKVEFQDGTTKWVTTDQIGEIADGKDNNPFKGSSWTEEDTKELQDIINSINDQARRVLVSIKKDGDKGCPALKRVENRLKSIDKRISKIDKRLKMVEDSNIDLRERVVALQMDRNLDNAEKHEFVFNPTPLITKETFFKDKNYKEMVSNLIKNTHELFKDGGESYLLRTTQEFRLDLYNVFKRYDAEVGVQRTKRANGTYGWDLVFNIKPFDSTDQAYPAMIVHLEHLRDMVDKSNIIPVDERLKIDGEDKSAENS